MFLPVYPEISDFLCSVTIKLHRTVTTLEHSIWGNYTCAYSLPVGFGVNHFFFFLLGETVAPIP